MQGNKQTFTQDYKLDFNICDDYTGHRLSTHGP